MEYRYKKNQIFRKKLDAPSYILNNVYNCSLSLYDYIKYDFHGKIPTSCLASEDRKIIEKFGIDACRNLDWELISGLSRNGIDFKEMILSIDSSSGDINKSIYEQVKDKISPRDYSPKMKEVYADRLFEMPKEYRDDPYAYLKYKFNEGNCSLEDILENFGLFEDKDISLCLLRDKNNTYGLTSEDVRKFTSRIGILLPYVLLDSNPYELINGYKTCDKKADYIRECAEKVLKRTYRSRGESNGKRLLELDNDVYRELFKHCSLEKYLSNFNNYDAPKIARELEELPEGYIFDSPIPFSVFRDYGVLNFIGEFGLKNVVDFDNECGQFFTKNNCYMLRLMNDMYLHYAFNEQNPKRRIYEPRTNVYDDDGRYVGSYYTKDGFYEAMRRMIVYGPTDWDYIDRAPDYRDMTGEFRVRNSNLFISEDAPEELKKLFYTKSLTPEIIVAHPDYIPYLEGKDLSSCFKNREIEVIDKRDLRDFENIYSFISEKADFNRVMQFIVEYADTCEIVFDYVNTGYIYGVKVNFDDSLEVIEDKICESLKKILVEKHWVYPKYVPDRFREKYPELFISNDAPDALKESFYSRTITVEEILNNPEYINYLKDVDFEVVFKFMEVTVRDGRFGRKENLISIIKKVFGDDSFDVMLLYGKYLEKTYEVDNLENLILDKNMSKEELLDAIDAAIYKSIVSGKMKYDDNMSSHFKNNYPMLFLGDSVSKDIKDKFYNREFKLEDFYKNPELIDMFGNTNIVCGFSLEFSWMIPLFNNVESNEIANYNRLKLISAYFKIEDVSLRGAFKDFILSCGDKVDMDKIEYASEVLSRLSLSNSSEIFKFRKELAVQILKSDKPLESLSKIEDIFVRSHIPTVGKIYSCFEVLHPDFAGFDFNSPKVSPMLKEASLMKKKILVFSDLIKASFGSNNRNVNKYLESIEEGSSLYSDIRDGKVSYLDLDDDKKSKLVLFSNHLATLYNNTKVGRSGDTFVCSGDVVADLDGLAKLLSEDGNLDYNLGDRVVRMFCGFAGINTLKEAKYYIEKKKNDADIRNRSAATRKMNLSKGDFIKGIGGIQYLRNILQNGSVAKEFLGASASSDTTPLDTDVSIITGGEDISEMIEGTAAKGYGPIWFVLKNDHRFVTTRTTEGLCEERDRNKLEVFYTGTLGGGHYGIRTGFASSEINYIIMEEFDPRVGLEIVMNGFYIPVADKSGNIIFTPRDYDLLKQKMDGLSYYGDNDYSFSPNLVTPEVEELAEKIRSSNEEVAKKREKINALIKEALDELGLKLKTEIDGDLTEGYVELIDTGSTGRGTNKPGDGDFDLMMRLDRTILSNPKKLAQLKKKLLEKLGRDNSEGVIGTGDFRLKDVSLDETTLVDIDITFTEKTDKVSYSTDMALQDRLETIKRQDPEKYDLVIANILLAKQVLKEAGVYKPNRGDVPQGGLGGVGIENWILQNGGSFVDAARSFVEVSEGRNFDEFQEVYQVWDFGDNHLAERRNQYAHDNFVSNNMSEEGFNRMVTVLSGFLKKADKEHTSTDSKKV